MIIKRAPNHVPDHVLYPFTFLLLLPNEVVSTCLSIWCLLLIMSVNILRPKQDGRYFVDDVLKCIFLNENVWISFKMSLNCVPNGPINNITVLIQLMAWRRPGDKPLFELMLVFIPTHKCVTRLQWVNNLAKSFSLYSIGQTNLSSFDKYHD